MPISFNSVLMLLTTCLLFWVLAGLTCFTTGLVRARNTNNILAKNMVLMAIAVLLFLPIIQPVMLSQGVNAFIPTFFTLHKQPDLQTSSLLFEILLAVIPLYIITGATAERLRLWPFILFSVCFLVFLYPVVHFWTWGSGFLSKTGFIDYGGATVLHLSGAVAALAALLFLGSRKGRYAMSGKSLILPGANIPFAMLGAMQIWIGSIGLNLGTTILHAPQGLALFYLPTVCMNTFLAAAAGLLSTLILTRFIYGTIDVTLLFNGSLAGIVAISAAPVLLNANMVILVGAVAGILTIFSLMACNRLRLDDPVGAIGVHGVGGVWGIVAVSFTYPYLPEEAHSALWESHVQVLGLQLGGLFSILLFIFVTSLLIWSIIRVTVGLRVKPTDECKGLDILTCGMHAYPEFIIPGQEK